MDDIKYLCPTCTHAAHDWCNVRADVSEAVTECDKYAPKGGGGKTAVDIKRLREMKEEADRSVAKCGPYGASQNTAMLVYRAAATEALPGLLDDLEACVEKLEAVERARDGYHKIVKAPLHTFRQALMDIGNLQDALAEAIASADAAQVELDVAEAELQCANAMLEEARGNLTRSEKWRVANRANYEKCYDEREKVEAENAALRELVGRLADKMSEGQWEQDKVTGEDVCSWCGDVRDITTGSDTCHCSWGQDINDARKLGLGG